jgi:hypothetical protein
VPSRLRAPFGEDGASFAPLHDSEFTRRVLHATVAERGLHMAPRQKRQTVIEVAAETAGRTLGRAAHTVEALRARHPHPVAEMQEAVATRLGKLAATASQARAATTAAVKSTTTARQQAGQKDSGAARNAKGAATAAKRKTSAGQARRTGSTTAASPTNTRTAKKSSPSTGRPRAAAGTSATAAKRKTSATSDADLKRRQLGHTARRQAHAASRTKRQQARRDRKR